MIIPFELLGARIGPVVISVPHAGRNYPTDIQSKLAVPLIKATALEDRYVDILITHAVTRGHRAIVARTPRLLIDLNRAETDFEPATIAGGQHRAARPSHRARGGLGLVPDRLGDVNQLWRDPLDAAALAERIVTVHRAYHHMLDDLMEEAHARFGVAILIDLHSMPALPGPRPAEIVIGDLCGRSASSGYVDAAHAVFEDRGLRVARNAPYAGGHILERHTRPAAGYHGVQIEVDRRLYLDSALDGPGDGQSRLRQVICNLADSLTNYAASTRLPIAAE